MCYPMAMLICSSTAAAFEMPKGHSNALFRVILINYLALDASTSNEIYSLCTTGFMM